MPAVSQYSTGAAVNTQATPILFSTKPVRVFKVYGFFNGVANAYLQFHNVAAPSSGTTVPAFASLLMTPGQGFMYSFENAPLLVFSTAIANATAFAPSIVVSTTEALYTQTTATVDLTVEYAVETLYPGLSLTVLGDLTTDVAELEVFTTDTTKALYEVSAKNTSGSDAYLLLYPYTVTDDTAVPKLVLPGRSALNASETPSKIKNGSTETFQFGKDGWQGNQLGDGVPGTDPVVSQSGATLYNGCYLTWSSTATKRTQVTGGPIRAAYLTKS